MPYKKLFTYTTNICGFYPQIYSPILANNLGTWVPNDDRDECCFDENSDPCILVRTISGPCVKENYVNHHCDNRWVPAGQISGDNAAYPGLDFTRPTPESPCFTVIDVPFAAANAHCYGDNEANHTWTFYDWDGNKILTFDGTDIIGLGYVLDNESEDTVQAITVAQQYWCETVLGMSHGTSLPEATLQASHRDSPGWAVTYTKWDAVWAPNCCAAWVGGGGLISPFGGVVHRYHGPWIVSCPAGLAIKDGEIVTQPGWYAPNTSPGPFLGYMVPVDTDNYVVDPSTGLAGIFFPPMDTYQCYEPVLDLGCAPYYEPDGSPPLDNPSNCVPQCQPLKCPSGDDPVDTYPGITPPPAGPYCVSLIDLFLQNRAPNSARNAYGQLFLANGGGVASFDDSNPEDFQNTSYLQGGLWSSLSCRGDGRLDYFFGVNYTDFTTTPPEGVEWLGYLYCEDSGRTWKPNPVGFNEWDQSVLPTGYPLDVFSADLIPDIPGKTPQGKYLWVEPIKLWLHRGADSRLITGVHHLMSKKDHELLVLVVNRGGNWYAYAGKQDKDTNVWTLSAPKFIYAGEPQSGWLQQTPQGEIEFSFFDTQQQLRRARCAEFGYNSIGSWQWFDQVEPYVAWDGEALERYTAITYHDTQSGTMVEIVWVPDQLGRIYGPDFTHSGVYQCIAHTWDPEDKVWVPSAPVEMFSGLFSNGGELRREKGGEWVLRLTNGRLFRCSALGADGVGDWIEDL